MTDLFDDIQTNGIQTNGLPDADRSALLEAPHEAPHEALLEAPHEALLEAPHEALLDGDFDDIIRVDQDEADPDSLFWRISRQDISGILKILKDISMRSTDQISRSVLIAPDQPGYLRLTCTNKDIYFSGLVKLKNSQNILNETLILSIKQLEDIVRFSYDLVIYKENETILAAFMRGKQPLDVYNFSHDIYTLPDYYSASPLESVPIDSLLLRQQSELFTALMSLAAVAEDKRMYIKSNYAYGSYVSSASRVLTPLPNMILKATDSRDLASILSIYSEQVQVSVSPERVFYSSPSFFYSSLLLDARVTAEMTSRFNETSDEHAFVDCNQFYNIASYLASTSIGAATMNFRSDHTGINLTCINKTGSEASFVLSDTASDLSIDVDMQVSLVRNVLKVLSKNPTIDVSQPSPGSIELSAGDVKVLIGCRDR